MRWCSATMPRADSSTIRPASVSEVPRRLRVTSGQPNSASSEAMALLMPCCEMRAWRAAA